MEAIGLASGGEIPDSSFTASSYFDDRYKASYGRLNGKNRGWAPKTTKDPADFLQVDLLYEYVICAVATQGANGINEWAINYKIHLSLDGITFFTYKENNIDKVRLRVLVNIENANQTHPIDFFESKERKVFSLSTFRFNSLSMNSFHDSFFIDIQVHTTLSV